MFRVFIVLLSSSLSCFSNAVCDPKELIKSESKDLTSYLDNKVASDLFQLNAFGNSFPVPNRYEVSLGRDSQINIKSYLIYGLKYKGCVGQDIPYGAISYGPIAECLYCSEEYRKETNQAGIKLSIFGMKGTDIEGAAIYDNNSFIQIIDQNSSIYKTWWKILGNGAN